MNWRRFGLATTSGSGAGFAPFARALEVEERSDETPRARAPTSFSVIDSLSVTIGSHLHRPTVIPRGAGVSVMLAERGPATSRLAASAADSTPCVPTCMVCGSGSEPIFCPSSVSRNAWLRRPENAIRSASAVRTHTRQRTAGGPDASHTRREEAKGLDAMSDLAVVAGSGAIDRTTPPWCGCDSPVGMCEQVGFGSQEEKQYELPVVCEGDRSGEWKA